MTEADGKPRSSTGHARAICVAPSVEHPPARGTMPCAQGAFSLTAMIFRSPRAQKGAWCARHRSDGRRGHRRQELAGVQAMGAGGGRQAQEGASWGRQEGNGGAGRRKRGQARGDDGAGRRKWGQTGRDDGAGRGLDEPEKRPTKY